MSFFNDSIQFDPAYLIFVGLFVGVLVAFEGVRTAWMTPDKSDETMVKRIKGLRERMAKDHVQLLMPSSDGAGRLSNLPLYGQVPARMRQAGMTMKPKDFIAICLTVSFVLFVFATFAAGIYLGIATALLSGIVIPMSVINIMRKKRVDEFAQQLPDALDLMKRGLRVGHPLNVTIQNVADNMPDPIASEFQIMSHQITYGDALVDAMRDMSNRIDQEDMHYLSAAVSIQHGSGGNLAAMLGTLATVIRQRYAMRRRIKAISSEGRISAWILSALPFLMYGGTSLTSPTYYSSVEDDPLFLPMAGVAIALVVANFFMLRNLVNFRI